MITIFLLEYLEVFFLKNQFQSRKTLTILTPYSANYQMILLIRLGTITYSLQLVDIFSYELPSSIKIFNLNNNFFLKKKFIFKL